MKPDPAQLRDIHLPGPVSWWPPAPGWWGVTALIVVALTLVIVYRRRRNRDRWRREALAELARLRAAPTGTLVAQLSVLLRRVAISRFPRAQVAGLTGDDWLVFLDETLGEDGGFTTGPGRLLALAPYQAQPASPDVEALFTLCARWIEGLPSRGRIS